MALVRVIDAFPLSHKIFVFDSAPANPIAEGVRPGDFVSYPEGGLLQYMDASMNMRRLGVGVIHVNAAAVGNVGSGTDDLMTFSLPANTLNRTGKVIRAWGWGTTANNVNAKTLTFNVGSQVVVSTALTASIAGQWETLVTIIRTGANTQDIRARTLQGATVIFDQELTAGTQTETAAITLKMTGAATADNDIVQEGMIIEELN